LLGTAAIVFLSGGRERAHLHADEQQGRRQQCNFKPVTHGLDHLKCSTIEFQDSRAATQLIV
jgi:hypothetical protein